MGDFNQTVVLDQIRRARHGVSRTQLTRQTGLSPQAVSNIAGRLLDSGLVQEVGETNRPGRGRPRELLGLNPKSRYAIGVHLDPTMVWLAIVGLDGRPTASSTITNPPVDPGEFTATLLARLGSLIDSAPMSRRRILGIGLAVPGPIDAGRGVMVAPPLLPGWQEVPLREIVQTSMDLPTMMDKDVNAVASAVVWDARRQTPEDFVFIYYGAGIAMTVVLGGEVLRGRSRNAGEAGDWLVDDDGAAIRLGEAAGMRGLVLRAIRAGIIDGEHCDLDRQAGIFDAFSQVCLQAGQDSRAAHAILAAALEQIGSVAGNLARQLDLSAVVIGGPGWERMPPRYLDILAKVLVGFAGPAGLWQLAVESAPFGELAGAVGGASLVLADAFAPSPRTLLLA